ncbi:unnamed protein product [Candidula unifasciata]|uniref:Carboxylic ester hydrolase n=1 Tax=Candidula unifasciata TaxID=100452 RepID=A0A8S3YV75_9EUPU|nr:unnamed protein product [Candidula unifasciata]
MVVTSDNVHLAPEIHMQHEPLLSEFNIFDDRTRYFKQKRPAMTKCINKWIVLATAVLVITIFAAFSLAHTTDTSDASTAASTDNKKPDPLLVETKHGRVRGFYRDEVRVFHGVPYAQDPSGDRRWLPPIEPKPWSDIFDATKIPPGCPQACDIPLFCSNQSSENCLFLEIYTPLPTENLVEVLVYLHGGGFRDVTSTVPIFDPTKLVQISGIIVVKVEYRIGALGFLNSGTGEDDAKGNYGLLDQRLALVWVSENIRLFGGDPDKVTLAGQSAGAQSVIFHTVSEGSSRYFRFAIIESPPLSLPYQAPKVAIRHAQAFSEILGCLEQNSTTVNISCLRQKPVKDILEAQKKADEDLGFFQKLEPWCPVTDGQIVTAEMLASLITYASSNKTKKPIIWSFTAEEAVLYVNSIASSPVPEFLYRIVLGTLLMSTPDTVTQLYPATNPNDTRYDLAVLFTDAIFRCPIRQMAQLLAQAARSNRVWVYKWAKSLANQLPEYFSFCTDRSCHGVTIPYFFQSFKAALGNASDEDIRMSNALIDYLTNFIKFGDPNGEKQLGYYNNTANNHGTGSSLETSLIYWPTVNGGQPNVTTQLLFTADARLEVTSQTTDERCQAWDSTHYSLR